MDGLRAAVVLFCIIFWLAQIFIYDLISLGIFLPLLYFLVSLDIPELLHSLVLLVASFSVADVAGQAAHAVLMSFSLSSLDAVELEATLIRE